MPTMSNEYMREYKKQWRAKRMAKGLCNVCGARKVKEGIRNYGERGPYHNCDRCIEQAAIRMRTLT